MLAASQGRWIDWRPQFAHTTHSEPEANSRWGHILGRPGTSLRISSLRLSRLAKQLGKYYSASSHRAIVLGLPLFEPLQFILVMSTQLTLQSRGCYNTSRGWPQRPVCYKHQRALTKTRISSEPLKQISTEELGWMSQCLREQLMSISLKMFILA